MSGRLDGKVAAITGAGGTIGSEAARAFTAEGARVAVLDRDQEAIRALGATLGPEHLALTTDITDESAVAGAFDRIDRHFGRLDVLYNCAAVQLAHADAPVDQLELSAWTATLAINLTGLFLCCKYGLRLMLRGGGGSVINCGSPAGISGRVGQYSAYSASKGGVHALTKAMAATYGKVGVRANILVPGAVPRKAGALQASGPFADQAVVARLASRSAVGRLGEASDLVGAAVFLASDESKFATGATFIIDGGVNVT